MVFRMDLDLYCLRPKGHKGQHLTAHESWKEQGDFVVANDKREPCHAIKKADTGQWVAP